MFHHANLLIGSIDWAQAQIPDAHRVEGQDVLFKYFESFSISDARTLIYESSLRPIDGKTRVFVLFCTILLREAQNALLKLLEEPNEHTFFYLVVPREDILIPTLKSRFHIFGVQEVIGSDAILTAFLKLTYAERLSCIAEKLQDEDTIWVLTLVKEIEQYAHTKQEAQLTKEVLALLGHININGSSKKMLLEHIALTL